MKIESILREIIYKVNDRKYNAELRKKLKTNQFSIICSNCIGGVIYHRLGIEFQSPTINQFMKDSDFLKFVFNMDLYLNSELIDNGTDGKYPLGMLGDIPVQFTHYKSAKEAIDAWNRRKERIDYDRLYLILFDTIDNEITKEDIIRFGSIKAANRIVLSKNHYPDIDYVYHIPLNDNDANRHYMARNSIGRRRYEEAWDFVEWINEGVSQSV